MIERALDYCRGVLRNVSRSFSLTIPLVERNILVPILVGYLEARIMDSFEDGGAGNQDKDARIENIRKVISVISDPESEESRAKIEEIVESAPDFITNPHYLDLVQNMEKVIEVHKAMDVHTRTSITLWFGRMAEGMEKYLNRSIDTFEQLDEYCYYVGGTVGGLLTDLVMKKSRTVDEERRAALTSKSNDFGLFLQKVNIIRDFRQDMLGNQKMFWPRQVFAEHGLAPRDVLERKNGKKAMKILEKMLSNAKKHVEPTRSYISAIPEDFPGFKKSSTINFLMGMETIRKMESNPDIFYSDRPVKIDKAVATAILSDPLGRLEAVHAQQ